MQGLPDAGSPAFGFLQVKLLYFGSLTIDYFILFQV